MFKKINKLQLLQLIILCCIIMPCYSQSSLLDNPYFSKPYIDKSEWRDTPIRHKYVHGGFEGTDTRFSFYFPEKETYQNRFFQYITPAPDSELISQGMVGEEDKIRFSVSHGAYFIETNGGGTQGSADDPLIGSYKANAACALYSRIVAREMYGEHRTYGYCFGGSGGAYRTVGGIESTEGVWDGAVPYVLGSPMAIPNVFSVRMHAMRTLKNKFDLVIDALEPGGSGDMYSGLTTEEKAALLEVTKMGFPPQSWFAYKTMGVHGFSAVYPGMVAFDPGYFTDFWNVPGYLGANPPKSLTDERLQFKSTVKKIITRNEAERMRLIPPLATNERGTADAAWKGQGQNDAGKSVVAFELAGKLPKNDFLGGDLKIHSGAAKGKVIQISKIDKNTVIVGIADINIVALIKDGDQVELDNSNFLAAQTYHRHQVPGKEYKVWDQFRKADGTPVYPQRPTLIAPIFTKSAAGVLPTGQIKAKVILLGSVWDREAYAWQCDWYRSQIIKNFGDKADDNFRLWYTDRAIHGDTALQEDASRTVSYLGVLQQALLDLSQWVEKGIEPAPTTVYTIEDGQVILPPNAEQRKGIQPTVSLTVNKKKVIKEKRGTKVNFTAEMQVPEGTGKIVSVAWDFEGDGTYTENSLVNPDPNTTRASVSHSYDKPGTYFATVRVKSQRTGDKNTVYTLIQNLDRVRVIIK